MKLPLLQLRQGLYNRLRTALETEGSTVKVWPFVAEPTTTKPAVILTAYAGTPRLWKGAYVVDVIATIGIVDEIDGDDRIATAIDQIVQAIEVSDLDLPDGWQEATGTRVLEEAQLFSAWTGERPILKGEVRYKWTLFLE